MDISTARTLIEMLAHHVLLLLLWRLWLGLRLCLLLHHRLVPTLETSKVLVLTMHVAESLTHGPLLLLLGLRWNLLSWLRTRLSLPLLPIDRVPTSLLLTHLLSHEMRLPLFILHTIAEKDKASKPS